MKEKERLLRYCFEYVTARIDRIKGAIEAAQSSANAETKSSMGDKYETGRAMAQLEIEQNTIQLNEAHKLLGALEKIDIGRINETISHGNLILTSNGNYFIAISIGVVKIDQKQYFIISEDSPIGKVLIGKKINDEVSWMGKSIKILKIQ